jgi:hypothetical protein
MHDDLTEAERDHAADLAYTAERFAAAYYGDDPEWLRWMRDLRDAFDRVYDPGVRGMVGQVARRQPSRSTREVV